MSQFRYTCSECDTEYISKDDKLIYCDSEECINKDNKLSGPYSHELKTIGFKAFMNGDIETEDTCAESDNIITYKFSEFMRGNK
jgi:hypothetical protein